MARRGLRRILQRTTVAFALGLILIPAAHAADPPAAKRSGKLADIERERKESEARAEALARKTEQLENEAKDTATALVALARDARAHEQAINDINRRLDIIEAERRRHGDGLAAKRQRLSQLIGALERIARHPPEAMMAYTRTPQDTLRGAMLLRAAIPKIEAEAGKLRASLEELARLGEQAAARSEALAREKTALDSKRKKLAVLLARKSELARSTKAEKDRAARQAQALAREAKDLRELLAAIERERAARIVLTPPRPPARKKARPPAGSAQVAGLPQVRPPAPLPPAGLRISRARGRLVTPVIGRVAVAFGAREEAGAAKGVRFETAEGAQVLAPFGGEVVFSGPFRGYGPLLIIDHGEGYHSLLAGLDRIDADVGQKLLAGEPVGIMPRRGKVPLRLYMELRRGGRPIDPLPWLAAPPNIKARG